jgi:hypothetical protein
MNAEPDRLPWPASVAVCAILALAGWLALRQVASLDAGFHLRAGNWILDGNGWPRTDPFTFTVSDHPYVDTSWGYQILLALTERLLGAPGMVLLHLFLVVAIFVLVVMTARLAEPDTESLLTFLLLGVIAAEMRFDVRPELLSYALLALVLYLLHRHTEGKRSPLWTLPVVFLVWSNCHSLFILGWAVLGCFIAGSWLRERRIDSRLVGWSAVSVVVALVNPYGWEGVFFPFTLATRFESANLFAQGIGEFQSPFRLPVSAAQPFYPWTPIVAYLVLFGVVLGSLPMLWRRRRYWAVLLAVPFLYLSAGMVRNVPLLVVVCLPGAIWGLPLGRIVRRVSRSGAIGRALPAVVVTGVLIAVVILGLRVFSDAYYIGTRRTDRFGMAWNSQALPVDVAEYLERARPSGRGLNHLNYGGYLMWASSNPVFIDGRLEVIGEAFYGFYRRALASEAALESVVRRYDIGWIVFPFKQQRVLLQLLTGDRRWRLVYFDAAAAVFVRADRLTPRLAHDSVRGLSAPPPALDLESMPGLDAPRTGRAARWLSGLVRRQSYPGDSFGRGLFHYFRRSALRAAPLFADAVRESGGAYYELYHNLGAALFRLERFSEARDCYRIVAEEAPENQLAAERLEQLEALLDPG